MDASQRNGAPSARPLDPVALARTAARLDAAATAPWLHTEVARRMAERLPVIKLQPQSVFDWGAFAGASADVLAAAYPQARVIAVERTPARRDATAAARLPPWWQPRRWSAGPAALTVDGLAQAAHGGRGGNSGNSDQAQLLWANMFLHHAPDPQAVMQQWQRALQVDGFLMFSTLGPGSLDALRALYLQAGWPAPFAPFVDMHDLGDMLVHAGFADPVMDQEQLALTWASADALLAELRSLGGNADPQRHAGLRTPRWRARLARRLAATAGADGRIALNFEVVYGHAFKAPPRPRLAAETTLPLQDMRAMVRAGRERR